MTPKSLFRDNLYGDSIDHLYIYLSLLVGIPSILFPRFDTSQVARGVPTVRSPPRPPGPFSEIESWNGNWVFKKTENLPAASSSVQMMTVKLRVDAQGIKSNRVELITLERHCRALVIAAQLPQQWPTSNQRNYSPSTTLPWINLKTQRKRRACWCRIHAKVARNECYRYTTWKYCAKWPRDCRVI